MALKTLIFGTDDIFNEFKPFYDREVQRGNIEIVDIVNDTGRLRGGAKKLTLPTLTLL